LQCEYGQLAGIETLLAQFSGQIVESEYQASVQLRVALPRLKWRLFQQNWLILVVVRCNY
jgi:putative IMPACT (imprinted ancient) family translation regulator